MFSARQGKGTDGDMYKVYYTGWSQFWTNRDITIFSRPIPAIFYHIRVYGIIETNNRINLALLTAVTVT